MVKNIVLYGILGSGIVLMAVNIYRYLVFVVAMRDVLSSGTRKDNFYRLAPLGLLFFFFIGFIFVAFIGDLNFLIVGILTGGSIFVSVMLTILFKLMNTVKSRSMEVVEVLMGVIESRDPNLNGHSRYVQNLTMLLYDALPYSIKKGINRMSLEYAALMHDVGKLGIPESILNKNGSLDDDEWGVMQEHPQIGVKLLEPLKFLDSIKEWILCHHERLDGSGYYNMKLEEIPLPSRLIAIADTYSAITMRRSYKPPKSHEEAIEIIKEMADSKLDDNLIQIFCSLPKEKLLACAPDTKLMFE